MLVIHLYYYLPPWQNFFHSNQIEGGLANKAKHSWQIKLINQDYSFLRRFIHAKYSLHQIV